MKGDREEGKKVKGESGMPVDRRACSLSMVVREAREQI